MKHVRRCVVALASLALTLTTLTTTAQAATPPPPRPAPATATATAPPAAPGKTCGLVEPGTKAYKEGAVKSCIEVRPGPARTAPKLRIPVTACTGDKGYASTRHSYCLEATVDYTLYSKDANTGAEVEIGKSTMHIAQHASLDSRGASWKEQVEAAVVQGTPTIGEMIFEFEASCSGQCTLANRRMRSNIGIGETKTAAFTFQTTVGNNAQTEIVPSYHLSAYSTKENDPSGHHELDNRWNNPNTLRCDQAVSKDANTGCIVMGNMADVKISIAKYGAAAITYQWAQNTLIGGNFGTPGHTLIRFRDDDGKIRDRNRYQSCEAAPNPFKPFLVTAEKDSCDEFPFAATAQGGTNGNLCSEIQPWFNSATGQWEVKLLRYPGPMVNCVRSHVPISQNTGAGSEYGNAVLSERILDGENFTVTITD